jgi:1-acyl-sn-glycerol-3-phosphate acyltransferase
MSLANTVVNTTIKGLTHILCRIDSRALAQVPAQGPLLLVANHVNFLDAPVMITHLQPRPLTGFVKAETWDNPVMGLLFNIWGGIPIRRGEPDMAALGMALEALRLGKIVVVAPEGTRSGSGRLKRGYPGIVVLALRSGAPLLPVAYYGGENFRDNVSRLRRTDFHINVGPPFTIDPGGQKVTRPVRQAITDEIMYQIAALLPEEYRGEYAELEKATQEYLKFLAV